jgi:hypothetical protein
MTTTKPYQIGDRYYQGHGLIGGRDVDDSATQPCETREAAQAAIESDWVAWLSANERLRASTYVREMEVLSIADDGTISSAASAD